jgi:hypothetical protein
MRVGLFGYHTTTGLSECDPDGNPSVDELESNRARMEQVVAAIKALP